jgi:hypothetical protein
VTDAVVVVGGEAQVGGELGTVGKQAAQRGWGAWAVVTGEGIDAGLYRLHQLLAGVGVQVIGLEDLPGGGLELGLGACGDLGQHVAGAVDPGSVAAASGPARSLPR